VCCYKVNNLKGFCFTEYITKSRTGADPLERCNEWELDKKFGKWKVQNAHGFGSWITMK